MNRINYKIMKKQINKLLHKIGYNISKHNGYNTVQNPFNLLELCVNDRIKRSDSYFVLQIGANDGIRFDSVYEIAQKHAIKGLLVEPLPDMFLELKENYKEHDGFVFENCAIGNEEGSLPFYRIKGDAKIPDWAHGLASFNKSHIEKFNVVKPELIEKITVPTTTFSSLLKKHNVDKIDLLVIDTEGFDYEILKMVMKAKVFPDLLQYEFQHLSMSDQLECNKLLVENNYEFIPYGRDIVAMRALN